MAKEGIKRLKDELDSLKRLKEKEFSKAIGEARAHGICVKTLNTPGAKEEQGRVEAKIRLLKTSQRNCYRRVYGPR